MSFKDKVVWITGASSGIGEAMAVDFAKEGSKVILSARREEVLNDVAAICRTYTDSVAVLPLDLAKTDEMESFAEQAERFFGPVDVLVNNGGISQRAMTWESTVDSIRTIMDVNFFGAVALTKAVLPSMMERKQGYIIVTSSVMGKFGTKFRSTYAASKHALHGWFDCLRQEMYDYNIDVTLVCPGYVKTDITVNAITADGSKFNQMGDAHVNAMTTEEFSRRLMPSLKKRKPEVYIGGKEVMAVYLKRFFPNLLNKVLRNAKVT